MNAEANVFRNFALDLLAEVQGCCALHLECDITSHTVSVAWKLWTPTCCADEKPLRESNEQFSDSTNPLSLACIIPTGHSVYMNSGAFSQK